MLITAPDMKCYIVFRTFQLGICNLNTWFVFQMGNLYFERSGGFKNPKARWMTRKVHAVPLRKVRLELKTHDIAVYAAHIWFIAQLYSMIVC
jgi:hypothetical protein